MNQKDILRYFEERFGISKKLFADHKLYSDQKGRVFLGPKVAAAGDIAVFIGMQTARIENGSSKLAKPTSMRIRPSTNFFQLFGKHATKNFISLSKEQAQAYAKGEDIELTQPTGSTEGYVLLKYLDYPLGCGLLKNGNVKNVLPKERRMKVEFL